MADVEKDNLGPWKDADLEATTTIHAGLGADAGIPKDVRFGPMWLNLYVVVWLWRLNRPTLSCPPFFFCAPHLLMRCQQNGQNAYLC